MSRFSVTDPRAALQWEIERAHWERPSYSTDPQPTTAGLIVLACSLALLAGVLYRLIDLGGNW